MALTKPIPLDLRSEMEQDPFYERCCLTGALRNEWTVIQWHHHFVSYLHGNRGRVNEKWCILPLTKELHDKAHHPDVRKALDRIMLNRATVAELLHWSSPAKDLIKYRNQLNNEYDKSTAKAQGRELPHDGHLDTIGGRGLLGN